MYKGLSGDSNAWYDIYQDDKGKWRHNVVSTFDAMQKGFDGDNLEYASSLIMRLFKKDLLELEIGGQKKYFVVVKFTESGPVTLAEHLEANVDKRNRDASDPFKFWAPGASTLQECGAKAVFISPTGKIIYRESPRHVTARNRNQRE